MSAHTCIMSRAVALRLRVLAVCRVFAVAAAFLSCSAAAARGCSVSQWADTEKGESVKTEFTSGIFCLDTLSLDSLSRSASADRALSAAHTLRPAGWIVPAAGVALGAVCVRSSWGVKVRRNLQRALSDGGRHKTPVDDIVQYMPAVAGYGLPLCGVPGRHGLRDRTLLLALSAATMAVFVNTMKPAFREPRPDTGRRNSFPSGHTATAFMGAEYLWQEYRHTRPWIGYAGYAVATGVGVLRVCNNRHWANDVLAGACIGILSTKLAYWAYPRLFRRSCCHTAGRVSFVGVPCCYGRRVGLSMAVVF